MSVNRRKGKYKTDKEFDEEQSKSSFVSKTQLKNQAQDLKKFGLELLKLNVSVLEKLPIGDVTLKSLLDHQKMTTNLARKRHLMFIGKCLRSENESEIREHLNSKERENINTMQQKANETQEVEAKNSYKLNEAEQFIEDLLLADSEKIELTLEENKQLERQSLRQIIRNCNSAKTEKKKQIAKGKLLDYIKTNNVNGFS